jgi:hypothetical protein
MTDPHPHWRHTVVFDTHTLDGTDITLTVGIARTDHGPTVALRVGDGPTVALTDTDALGVAGAVCTTVGTTLADQDQP